MAIAARAARTPERCGCAVMMEAVRSSQSRGLPPTTHDSYALWTVKRRAAPARRSMSKDTWDTWRTAAARYSEPGSRRAVAAARHAEPNAEHQSHQKTGGIATSCRVFRPSSTARAKSRRLWNRGNATVRPNSAMVQAFAAQMVRCGRNMKQGPED